jgi:hypothetical protein
MVDAYSLAAELASAIFKIHSQSGYELMEERACQSLSVQQQQEKRRELLEHKEQEQEYHPALKNSRIWKITLNNNNDLTHGCPYCKKIRTYLMMTNRIECKALEHIMNI